jgi:cell division septum initiation protein DivIVA
MADAVDSHNIARRTFEVVRRGYEQQEVRGFLHEIGSLVERLHRESVQLRERAERAEARLEITGGVDEAMLLEVLGEETTRVLTSARESAAEIRAKAEAAAERIVADATAEASEARAEAIRDAERRLAEAAAEQDALLAEARGELERRQAEAQEAAALIRSEAAEAAQALRDEGQHELERVREASEAELAAARAEGKRMVAEAQAVRERVLRDLSARRKKARVQVEKLNAGRERLLEAYAVVRRTIDEATEELSTSLTDARMAADAAARRIEEEPEPTLEELDEEVRAARIVDLPIAALDEPADEHDHGDAPGALSGEVPAVDVDVPPGEPVAPSVEPEPAPGAAEPPVDLRERRGRKRRKKDSFEGLPAGELTRVQPPAAEEGVRVLGDPATAPDEEPGEPAPPADDGAPADVEPDAAVEAHAPAPDEEGEGGSSVDDLFARLRASEGDEPDRRDGTDDETVDVEVLDVDVVEVPKEEVLEVVAEPDAEPAGAIVEDEDDATPTPFTERDALLDPIDKELGRRLKRALADEQNEVLDLLRRQKPKGVDDVLPAPDAHAARWSEVVAATLTDAAAAGAAWRGGKAGSTAALAEELAAGLTAPLRDRIDRGFAAADGNLDDVADRVRALYREWKGQRLTDTSRHYTAAAFAQGVFDATPKGATVHWVVDPLGDRCPDCDDNVLGGDLEKGTEFPTGHACAPAHPGCRCLVLAVDR